jgi:DNA-binding LacI/PurR family transcriptional regulator
MELCLIWRLVLLRRLGAMEQSDPFPQDLAVMGFDNTVAAKLITPWLVTVRQPMADKEPMVSRAFPSAK